MSRRTIDNMVEVESARGRQQIRRLLTDYPNISTSMIGIHVRPSIGRIWKSILDEMVAEGEVIVEERTSVDGRTITVHYLPDQPANNVAAG